MALKKALLLLLPFMVSFQDSPAQNGISGRLLSEKFTEFNERHLQEKLFIHTDRNTYLTGEHIWLKLYCVDGTDHRPLNMSKIAYIELLDSKGKAVIQIKVGMDQGIGIGTIFLPISIESGNYLLRAYTSWMKNYGPDLYFQQLITVVNPFTKLPESLASGSSPKYDVQFFPEGGDLLDGIRSTVAFRAVDQSGHGIDFKGVIVNDGGDTLAAFKPLKFGMGRFDLVPQSGRKARALITDTNQQQFTFDLPRVNEEGYVLKLTEREGKITISATTNLQKEGSLHVLVHTRNRINLQQTKQLLDGRVAFTFDRDLLQEGISHITLFSDSGLPVAERLYFIKPSEKLTFDADLNQVDYGIREKVTLDISSSLLQGMGASANLSISVFSIDSMQSSVPSIVDCLFLTSELRGNVESPGYYFEKPNTAERAETSDNLMLTQGWTRFKWEDVFAVDQEAKYAPELNGHLVHGQITVRSTHEPANGTLTFFSLVGHHGNTYVSRGDEQGKLMFELDNFYGKRQAVVRTEPQERQECDVEIFPPFSNQASSLDFPPFRLSESLKESVEQQSLQMQVLNIFHEEELNSFDKLFVDSLAFYGYPNERYDLDDFTRFKTMEEVMREYVSGVMVRKRDDGWHFFNYDKGVDVQSSDLFTTDPLVLLNGVAVSSIDDIMALDPLLVKYIEVVTRRYQQGVAIFDGVVHFKTYDGELAGFQPGPESLIFEYDGLNQRKEFFSPLYETPTQMSSTIPDTRTLLYWSPSLNIGGGKKTRVEFYTSDIIGKYKVVIQGIDNQGNPDYTSETFAVRR